MEKVYGLVILNQDVAAQFRAEVAIDTGGERRDHALARGRQPALAAIADHMRSQDEILHHEVLVSFEPGSRWHGGLDDTVFVNGPLGGLRPAAPPLWLSLTDGTARLFHPARCRWLDVWPALQTLEPCDLLALLDHDPAQLANPLQQFNDKSPQFLGGQRIDIGRAIYSQNESELSRRA